MSLRLLCVKLISLECKPIFVWSFNEFSFQNGNGQLYSKSSWTILIGIFFLCQVILRNEVMASCCCRIEIKFSYFPCAGIVLSQWDIFSLWFFRFFFIEKINLNKQTFCPPLFTSILTAVFIQFLLMLWIFSIFDVINSWLYNFIHRNAKIENRIRLNHYSNWLLLFANGFFCIRLNSSRYSWFQFSMNHHVNEKKLHSSVQYHESFKKWILFKRLNRLQFVTGKCKKSFRFLCS